MGEITRRIAAAVVVLSLLLSLVSTSSAASFSMKIAGIYPDLPVPIYVGADHIKARVEEMAKGKYDIRVTVHKGTLGGERQYYEGMQTGTIEGCACSVAPAAGFVPAFDLYNLPFLFKSYEHVFRVTDGPVGAKLADMMLAKGIRVLGYWSMGPRVAYNSKHMVNTPADFKGLKIRTPETPPLIAYYRALGAIPTPIARPEVYTALKQGVIDGVDATFEGGINFKDYEVAKYAPALDHSFTVVIFGVSERWWKTLPPGLQQIIIQAEKEARPLARKADEEVAAAKEKEWVKLGGQVNHPDRQPFRALAAPTWKQFVDQIPPDLVQQAVDAGKDLK